MRSCFTENSLFFLKTQKVLYDKLWVYDRKRFRFILKSNEILTANVWVFDWKLLRFWMKPFDILTANLWVFDWKFKNFGWKLQSFDWKLMQRRSRSNEILTESFVLYLMSFTSVDSFQRSLVLHGDGRHCMLHRSEYYYKSSGDRRADWVRFSIVLSKFGACHGRVV